MTSANRAAVSGPMSSPRPDAPNGVSSIASARCDDVLGVGAELRGDDDVGRAARARRRAPRPRRGSRCTVSSWSSSSRLAPTLWPWAARKVNSIPPPMSSRVDARQQVRDDAELVADLRAAEHDRVRPLGVLGEAVEHVELRRDQQAGGARQQLGELVDARLLAVHDAEAVRDERVAELGELVGERARARRRPSPSRPG